MDWINSVYNYFGSGEKDKKDANKTNNWQNNVTSFLDSDWIVQTKNFEYSCSN